MPPRPVATPRTATRISQVACTHKPAPRRKLVLGRTCGVVPPSRPNFLSRRECEIPHPFCGNLRGVTGAGGVTAGTCGEPNAKRLPLAARPGLARLERWKTLQRVSRG